MDSRRKEQNSILGKFFFLSFFFMLIAESFAPLGFSVGEHSTRHGVLATDFSSFDTSNSTKV